MLLFFLIFFFFSYFFIFSGPWVLVGLFNLTTREDARAVALSHLPMGRMEERRAAGGGGAGGQGEERKRKRVVQRSPSDSPKEVFAFEFWRSQWCVLCV